MKNKLFHALIIVTVGLASCIDEKEPEIYPEYNEFSGEKKVNIIGYNSDAMEPFITKDDKYLFFNNLDGDNNKDLFYAEKINDTTFLFKGEIQGVNTPYVDANPSMDTDNNFFFISTRDLDAGNKTLYEGIFDNGTVTQLHQISGTINIPDAYMINMGVEISKDGNTLFVSNAKFENGANFPSEGDIRFALKEGDDYNIPANESYILQNINTNYAIEYAGELSSDGLELFYSQVTLSDPPVFKLFRAERKNTAEPFSIPQSVNEPFKNNINAFVEAPSLSADEKKLYYHKLQNDTFSIFMLSRN
ncbi:MAG: hypothetical protein GXO50_09400 [Chlorobi bacterium]|nr:hypothetical protein [Chlorobiota bacterium]